MNTILRKQFLTHVGQTSPSPMLVEVERAEGVFFYTPEGKRYFDLISGVSVSNVGHANPQVVEAVCAQARDYMHVMVYGEMVERPQVEYATRICSLLPEGLDSVYFLNSGAEAVEGALKLAKRYTGRGEIVSMRRAYHGSTHGSLSIMGLMNDTQNRVQLLIDRELLEDQYLGCHPCINTSTLKMDMSDVLEKLIPAMGHPPKIVELYHEN